MRKVVPVLEKNSYWLCCIVVQDDLLAPCCLNKHFSSRDSEHFIDKTSVPFENLLIQHQILSAIVIGYLTHILHTQTHCPGYLRYIIQTGLNFSFH